MVAGVVNNWIVGEDRRQSCEDRNIRQGSGGMLLKDMFKIKSGMGLGTCSSRKCLRLNLEPF